MASRREHLRLYRALTGREPDPAVEDLMDAHLEPFRHLHHYYDNTFAKLRWIVDGFGPWGGFQAVVHMLADWGFLERRDIELLERGGRRRGGK